MVFSGYLDAGNVSTQIENAFERLEQRLATFDIDRCLTIVQGDHNYDSMGGVFLTMKPPPWNCIW